MAARPADDKVVGIALKWVEDNPTHQQAYGLLEALVAARPADDKVVGIALKWVEDNPTHQQAYHVLAALVAARPADDKVVGIALKWVEDNPTHQQAYHVLAALVAARPADDQVVGIALKWVEDNPTHQQAYELIRAVVAARPADDKVVGIALKWVEDNPTHQQAHELIRALVAARRADDQVVGIALKWVEDNPTHQQAYELIKAVVAARPADDQVIGVARIWLDLNANHLHAYELLRTLITRSDGAGEWMHKGQEALFHATGGAKRSLLIALLAGSKASQHYVELTLDAIEIEPDIRNKTFLLGSLGRCLANNVPNALLFLSGQSAPGHKRVATQALARGFRKYPNRAQEFLEQSHASPTEYAGFLLSACIASEVSGDVLNGVLRSWLNDHQYRKGYGAVLKTLKQHPARWQALTEFGGLSVAVKVDYRNT